MTEEEIRADERERVAARINAAADRYAAMYAGAKYVRGVRMAATIAAVAPARRLTLVPPR